MDNERRELVVGLELLRRQVIDLSKKLEQSGVQRTAGLLQARGPLCPFYKKSLALLLGDDYENLQELVFVLAKQFKYLEDLAKDE